jgi:hypothetical protein
MAAVVLFSNYSFHSSSIFKKFMKTIWALCALLGSSVFLFGQTSYVNGSMVSEGPTNGCTDTGTVNALSCQNPAGATVSGYYSNQLWTLKVLNTNTAAVTFKLDNLSPIAVKKVSNGTLVDLAAGDLTAGKEVTLVYDGNVFEVVSSLGTAPAQPQINTALYNDPQLTAWNTAFNNAANQVVKVAVIGDSISRDNQTMFAGVGPANPSNVWPRALASILQTKGNHGPGLITLLGDGNGAHLDDRITMSGSGWTTVNVLGPYQAGTLAYNSLFRGAAGATLDLAAQQADSFKFYCAIGSDSSNGFSVSIDGGTATTICNTTGSLTTSIQTVSAGSIGSHTVHMVVPAGAGFGYLYGIEPTIGSTGIQVDNYAIGASRSDAYGSAVASQFAYLESSNSASPYSLVIISLRTNDEIHAAGNSSAQYQTYLSNIVSRLNGWAHPPSILVLDAPPLDIADYPPPNGEPESNYQAAELAVVNANAANTVYLSIASRWISAANAQALGLEGTDKLHPIDKGALDIANFVASRIMDVSGSGSGITSISPIELGSDYARVRAPANNLVGTFATADQTLANVYRWGTAGTAGLLQLPGSANFLYHETTGFSSLTSLANDHVIFGGNVFNTGGLTDNGSVLQFKGTESHAGAAVFNGNVTINGTCTGCGGTSSALPAPITATANGTDNKVTIPAGSAGGTGIISTPNETGTQNWNWGVVGTAGVIGIPANAAFLFHEGTGNLPFVNKANDHTLFGANTNTPASFTDDGNAFQFKGSVSINNGTNPILGLTSTNATQTDVTFNNSNAITGGIHNFDLYANATSIGMYDDTGNTGMWDWNPTTKNLSSAGGLQMNTNAIARPTCNTAHRGTFWFTNNGASKDTVEVCVFSGTALVWAALY